MSVVENLEPKQLWKHFDEIRKIPRCSKHEEKIRQYLLDFARKQGLKLKTDKPGNIVISKPASPGMEGKPIVILQSHMDMVCEKNSDVDHDFTKDTIKLKLEGDILTADGTTLGADNGIGIAITMAILEDKALKHGPLEALFTVDEETGLTGAFALKSDMLTGKIMLNIDSEDFGVLTVGCAGGGDSKITLPIKKQSTDRNTDSILIKITGLRGGHSGIDINEQRANAIKILARLLWITSQKHDFRLSDIKGGDKHNAIPRESYAKVSISSINKNNFIADLKAEEKDIFEEVKPIDPNFRMEIEDIEKIASAIDKKSQLKLINLLHGLPHGVDKMSYDIPNLVETSTNLATVVLEGNNVQVGMSSRSSIMAALQDLRNRIRAIAKLSGAKVSEKTPYPGWKPNLKSNLLAHSKKTFKEIYGKEPEVEAIHAGLECGIIGEKFPGMDMISIGPTIKYPHSPEEQVQVSTVRKFYEYVLKILENV
ncbi:MAG: aminoacyl-histidine dipeptidase [Thermoplasmatales archaeon]|nr:MAG: aminoacyl-histidine dipeptidase [Thermoplasmatales archaeon]